MAVDSEYGFHKVKRVQITHGVPVSEGFFRTGERVQVRLPASAIGEKSAINLLVSPIQYAETRATPGIVYVGLATFWLYRDSVFADFWKRKQAEVKPLADALFASLAPRPRSKAKVVRIPARRETIPKQVKIDVWQRDSGRCVECGSNSNLEFDHIIPLKLGGANTFRNLQLMCGPCNRSKGAAL